MNITLNMDLHQMKKDLNKINNKQGDYKGISKKAQKELRKVATESINTLETILFFENDLRV